MQVKTREKGARRSTAGIVVSIFKLSGPSGFFHGLSSKLMQTVSNSAFIFMFYEIFLRLTAAARRSRTFTKAFYAAAVSMVALKLVHSNLAGRKRAATKLTSGSVRRHIMQGQLKGEA